jgi:A/G-specific adenine glycosylase
LGSQKFEQAIQQFVDQHLPSGRAGDFNQAWMDLGSAICLPKSPCCDQCPLNFHCLAYQAGDPSLRPVRLIKQAIPEITVTAGILRSVDGDEVLLALRPQNGLLGGLWEYPGGKLDENEVLEDCLKREWQEELGVEIQVGPLLGVYSHAYTHFKVILHAFFCQIITGTIQALAVEEFSWVRIDALDSYPMGKIDRMISREIQRIQKN